MFFVHLRGLLEKKNSSINTKNHSKWVRKKFVEKIKGKPATYLALKEAIRI